jgi:hypothetical protein
MRLIYDVELEDLVIMTDHHVRHSPSVQRQINGLRWACAALAALAIAGTGYLMGQWPWFWVGGGALGAGIGFVMFPRWFYRANQNNTRRLYQEGRNPSVLGRHTLELGPQGLRDRSEGGEELTAWSSVERVAVTDTHAFVYIGSVNAHPIPRARIVEGDLDAFVTELRERAAGGSAGQADAEAEAKSSS